MEVVETRTKAGMKRRRRCVREFDSFRDSLEVKVAKGCVDQ